MLACPFCGARQTDRFELDGRRFLVFACMFTPEVDTGWAEEELPARLAGLYRPDGSGAYFRRMCDRLHLHVTAGAGGRALRGEAAATPAPDAP